jgi:hypothetical protein
LRATWRRTAATRPRQNRRCAKTCARLQTEKIVVSGAETVSATGTIRPCG